MRIISFTSLFLVPFFLLTATTFAQKKTAKKPAHKDTASTPVPLPAAYTNLLSDGSQAILVTTPGWNSVDGTLQRYERNAGRWQPIGEKIAIVIGKSGLAWDGIVEPAPPGAPIKKEGDGRSPAGIFTFGQAFGFQPSAPDLKLPYLPLTDSIECVDDASSQSYNQLVDRQQLPHPDWSSSEKMRTIDVYKEGLVVNYNAEHIAGAGSCIFMHIWSGAGHGTAGCTAMDESKLREILNWLDESKKPVLIQLPAQLYNELKSPWSLP